MVKAIKNGQIKEFTDLCWRLLPKSKNGWKLYREPAEVPAEVSEKIEDNKTAKAKENIGKKVAKVAKMESPEEAAVAKAKEAEEAAKEKKKGEGTKDPKYIELVSFGKEAEKKEDIKSALDAYVKAQKITNNSWLKGKVAKLEPLVKEAEEAATLKELEELEKG